MHPPRRRIISCRNQKKQAAQTSNTITPDQPASSTHAMAVGEQNLASRATRQMIVQRLPQPSGTHIRRPQKQPKH
ncbi:hypothetical protein PSYJA_34760, partial [Pseudomonas syringae pv. japonica str. M301072]